MFGKRKRRRQYLPTKEEVVTDGTSNLLNRIAAESASPMADTPQTWKDLADPKWVGGT